MRIFISFASEQEDLADAVYRKLLSAGYDPFYSTAEVRPSDAYDARIREEIERADRMVFLASPQALQAGRYTLTELELAENRWPDPSKRVLTVVLQGQTVETLPAYLRAVGSVMKPRGNAASEVVAKVLQIWPLWRRTPWLLGTIAACLLVALGWYLLVPPPPPPPPPTTDVALPFTFEKGLDAGLAQVRETEGKHAAYVSLNCFEPP